MSPFSIFYYLVLSFIYILAIPYLIFKSRNSKYRQAIPAKFFLKDNVPFKENGIWFHSCSMGETKAIKPLIENYLKDVNISVITNTGFEEAKTISEHPKNRELDVLLSTGEQITTAKLSMILNEMGYKAISLTESLI